MNLNVTKNRNSILVLLAITLIFRLWTVMMIHTGVDERDYWYSAKAITQETVYPDINHRTVRWGVIIPVAVTQLITGIKPNAYYVMPILNSLVQSILLFLLGVKIKNRATGFLASLMLIFFPYQIRSASQVRPEIFSITYILFALYFLFCYFEQPDRKKNILSLVIAGIFLFIAYLTKITNLFFLPAFVILIFLYKPRSAVRDSLIFGGVLFFPFVIETVLYALFTGYRFGQLSVILSNHIADMETIDSFLDVFKRYSFVNLQLYWHIPLFLFLISSLYTLTKNRKKELVFLIIPVISFLFFITFTISGLHPLKMAEPFVNRYFSTILPPIFLLLAWYTDELLLRKKWYIAITKNYLPLCSTGSLIFMLLFSAPFLPARIKNYIHSPFDHKFHPFNLNLVYQKEINDAWKNHIPIVAMEGNAGTNALYTASWYYLDKETYIGDFPPRPASPGGFDGNRYRTLDGKPLAGQNRVLAVVRNPFTCKYISSESLVRLESEKLPE